MEHDDFLNGWLTGNTLTAWKTVRARVKSGVVISPGLGLDILDAIDKLAGDITAAVEDRLRAETEVARLREVLTAVEEIALAAPELNMNNYDEDQVSTLNEAMIGVCGILLKEAARRTVVGGVMNPILHAIHNNTQPRE